MHKVLSFLYVSVIQIPKNPPNPKTVPTALLWLHNWRGIYIRAISPFTFSLVNLHLCVSEMANGIHPCQK